MLGAQRVCHMTPLEVDLLFRMADLNGGQGRIDMDIIDCITPLEEGTMPYHIADQQKVHGTASARVHFMLLLWILRKINIKSEQLKEISQILCFTTS